MTPGSIQCTQEKTLFYSESKLGDLNANWIPILSVSIFASYNFTPFVFVHGSRDILNLNIKNVHI